MALNGGIIGQASNAADRYSQAANKENDVLLEAEIAILKARGKSGIEIMNELGEEPKTEWAENVEVVLQGVPIPKGFEYVEGTKSTGLVVKNSTDNSEFVWVPIADINAMVIIDGVSAENHAGRLYCDSETVFNSNLTGQSYTENVGLREPDIITNNTMGTGTKYDGDVINFTNAGMPPMTAAQFRIKLQEEFNEMVASVEKYKGFYIGRYETSLNGAEIAQSKINENAMTNVTWYYMYQKQKEMYSSFDNVVSGMIWGCQFDQALKFIENNTTLDIMDSTDWGNFSDSTVAGAGSVQKTGFSENWKACNIYDLKGNTSEWTLSANETGRAQRRR